MSQFKGIGIHPETKREVYVLFGYDTVPGFRPGHFFQVYLKESDPDFKEDSDNCICNLGMLDGITDEELRDAKKKWKVLGKKPSNTAFWIKGTS